MESVDTFVIFSTTSTSATLSITAVGLIIIILSTEAAYPLSLGKKIFNEIIRIKSENGMKKIREQNRLLTLLVNNIENTH